MFPSGRINEADTEAAGRTTDVSFVGEAMRRIGSRHGMLTDRFNTSVLALLIHIGAGLSCARGGPATPGFAGCGTASCS